MSFTECPGRAKCNQTIASLVKLGRAEEEAVKRLRAQVAKLTEDNDKAHELAEHYRHANHKLRSLIKRNPAYAGHGNWIRLRDEDIDALLAKEDES